MNDNMFSPGFNECLDKGNYVRIIGDVEAIYDILKETIPHKLYDQRVNGKYEFIYLKRIQGHYELIITVYPHEDRKDIETFESFEVFSLVQIDEC